MGELGETKDRLTATHWLIMIVAGGAWLFDNMDQRLFSLARIPALAALMHVAPDDAHVQAYAKTVTATFLVGWGVGGLLFGAFGDRFGRVRVLSIAILLYGCGTAATATATTASAFLMLRFLTGLGIGGVFGLAAAIISDAFEGPRRVAMLAVLQILSTIGNLCAVGAKMAVDGLAEAGALDQNASWRVLFALGGLPTILALVAFARLDEPDAWHAARSAGSTPPDLLAPYRRLLEDHRLRRNLVIGTLLASAGVIGLWGVGEYAVDLQDAVFRRHFMGIEPQSRIGEATAQAKNLAYLLQMVGAAAGMLVFAWAANRHGHRPVFMAAFLCAFVTTLFTYACLDTPGDSYWMMPLMGAAQFSVFVGFSLYLPELFPSAVRATGISFCYNFGRFAAAGGSLVSAALSTRVFAVFASPAPLRYSAMTVSVVFLVGFAAAWAAPETMARGTEL